MLKFLLNIERGKNEYNFNDFIDKLAYSCS